MTKQASNKKAKVTTLWGGATVVEEIRVPQRAGDKRFASVFQLLEDEKGEFLVRIAYSTDGVNRRGPVTLRLQDVERLHGGLLKAPSLAQALGLNGGAAANGGGA